MLRSIKLRVSDWLQANISGKVSISEPHEEVLPCSHQKNSSDLHKARGWPWPKLGSPDPLASYAPDSTDGIYFFVHEIIMLIMNAAVVAIMGPHRTWGKG